MNPLELHPVGLVQRNGKARPLLFVVHIREFIKQAISQNGNRKNAPVTEIVDQFPGLLPYPSDDAATRMLSTVETMALRHLATCTTQFSSDCELPRYTANVTKIRKAVVHLRFGGFFEPTFKANTYYYIAFNKPPGVLCERPATTSPEHPRTKRHKDCESTTYLYDVLPSIIPQVPHVGRIDRDTEGLMLLTDDGHLHAPLLNKDFQAESHERCLKASKVYYCDVAPGRRMSHENTGNVDVEAAIQSMTTPLEYTSTKGGSTTIVAVCDPALVSVVTPEDSPELFQEYPLHPGSKARFRVEICEGKFHQVRRICARAGLEMVRLLRYSFGPINLSGLGVGQARVLTDQEAMLLQTVHGARKHEELARVAPLLPCSD